MTAYTDTPDGVRALLLDMADSTLVPKTMTADPEYDNCWRVVCTNGVVLIVYTYDHPLGPDFEEVL